MDVISPELVLVSPPELAAEARLHIPEPLALSYVPRLKLSRRAIGMFYVCCTAGTLGPLLLAYAAR